jgi:hypothetical protein
MASSSGELLPQFRVFKGEALFQDGEDSVHIHYLQKQVGGEWINVFQLTMETGRSWGDEIDLLFRHKTDPDDLLVHVSGFGYWGDTEYYRSVDGGCVWEPTRIRRTPDPESYRQETLPQV